MGATPGREVGRGAARARHARAQLPRRSAGVLADRAGRSHDRPVSPSRGRSPTSRRSRRSCRTSRGSRTCASSRRAEGAARDVVGGNRGGPLASAAAAAGDRARVEKTLARAGRGDRLLWPPSCSNPAFLDKAPAPVVEKTRRRLVELEQRRAALGRGARREGRVCPMIPFADGGLDPRRWKVFENLASLRAIGSSNDLARRADRALLQRGPGALHRRSSSPRSQTAARGRTGRWHAPPGIGVYFTFVAPSPRASRCRSSRSRSRAGPGRPAGSVRRRLGAEVAQRPLRRPPQARRHPSRGADPGGRDVLAVGIGLNVSATPRRSGCPRDDARKKRRAAPSRLRRPSGDPRPARPGAGRPAWAEEVAEWERASLHRPGDRMTVRRDGEEFTGAVPRARSFGFLRLKTDPGEAVRRRRERWPSGEGSGAAAARRGRREHQHRPGSLRGRSCTVTGA